MSLFSYSPGEFFDELFEGPGKPRPGARILVERLDSLNHDQLTLRQQAAELALLNMGITFNVYGDSAGVEKIFPFDIIPRILEKEAWDHVDRGLRQRITALNLFLDDLYHDQKILKDGVIPRFVIESSKGFLASCRGLNPPHGTWCHIAGIDLVRDEKGEFFVLEDNLRCPSGVSYVLENRQVLKRILPTAFQKSKVQPVDDYPARLLDCLTSISPEQSQRPTVVLLTPGVYNAAYFEHAFLAQKMGVELVEGRDLVVLNGEVCMRTTRGLQRVDVIYRRIDDDFLDPNEFRSDSMLGVPGLMEAYRNGTVAIANAPGTGVADDKVVYAFVPQVVKYYLGEEAVLPNVPTYLCWEDSQRQHVLENLDSLVVKAANESGGYGMLIGPHSTSEQREEFRRKIEANPRNYIAQPTVSLSRAPVLVEDHFEGRHVDLRPYILSGKETYILPGGLTRVALTKGSLVVNSSQGGGSKDTWVLSQ
ncbi:MAG: circularly permuted type 2 ATP-grasp protein [Acidobacteriota bacterium]|nr:MAG: circularly permuted type 2 ATP-grasp protein [Acidobacteriota bacterium]